MWRFNDWPLESCDWTTASQEEIHDRKVSFWPGYRHFGSATKDR
jgi:hypothetical protein